MGIFIIAEIGSVHDGSFGNAKQAVLLAKECGADAVKYQAHIAEAESLQDAPAPSYFSSEPRWDYFNRTSFSADQWREIKRQCEEHEIEFMASPFSEAAVQMLEKIGMRRWKIPSGEVTNLPMIERISLNGGEVILSSGMSNWDELDRAVKTIRDAGAGERLTVLQCTSEYPCPVQHVGINIMEGIALRYHVPVGLSDHTQGIFAPVVAVSRGAVVIEKHLTFSKRMYGSDARHSLEPKEFSQMVQGVRDAEIMLNTAMQKDSIGLFVDMKNIFEKSIVLSHACTRGTVLTREDLFFKKPGTGVSAARWRDFIGRRLIRDMSADEMLLERDVE